MSTIRDMITALEDIAEQYGDDTKVLAAHQPSWPLAETIANIVVVEVDSNGTVVGEQLATSVCEALDAVGGKRCGNLSVVFDDDTELCLCAEHAEEFGVEYSDDPESTTHTAFITLAGAPSSVESDGWSSPYASGILSGDIGESFYC